MQAIGDLMNTQLLDGRSFEDYNIKFEPAEYCAVCGKPNMMRGNFYSKPGKPHKQIFGRPFKCSCDCDKKRRSEEDAASRQIETESRIKRNKLYSLMDEKARAAVFENLIVTDNNRRYIEAAKNYCEQWEENYRNNRGLLFYGKTGRGKTTLACCIANRLINEGVAVKAISANNLIQRVRDSFNAGGAESEAAIKAEIKNAPLLVLDDLGAEHKTDWSASFMYEIIDARYRSLKPSVITTNLTLKQLAEHLTDANGIPRAYDRLVEMLYPVEFTGGNYRTELSRKNRSGWSFFKGVE